MDGSIDGMIDGLMDGLMDWSMDIDGQILWIDGWNEMLGCDSVMVGGEGLAGRSFILLEFKQSYQTIICHACRSHQQLQ